MLLFGIGMTHYSSFILACLVDCCCLFFPHWPQNNIGSHGGGNVLPVLLVSYLENRYRLNFHIYGVDSVKVTKCVYGIMVDLDPFSGSQEQSELGPCMPLGWFSL